MSKYKFLACMVFLLFPVSPLFSQSAREYNDMGLEYFNQGEYTLAENYFKLAIKIDPKFKEAHKNLGILKLNNKEYFEAYKFFKIALFYFPCEQIFIRHLKNTTNFVVEILRDNLKKSTETLGESGKIVNLEDPRLIDYLTKVTKVTSNSNTCFICKGTGFITCDCKNNGSHNDIKCSFCKDKIIYICPVCDGTGGWCPR